MKRIESSTTAISWIPSEAITGSTKVAFGPVAHYDDPPPDRIAGTTTEEQTTTLGAWRDADRFRFANQLAAWIDVDGATIVGAGYSGGGHIGTTRLDLGPKEITFRSAAMPMIQTPPEHGDGWVRFRQTWGGRTGVPAPRHVNHPPFVQYRAPLAWSTLALTLHVDGRCEYQLIGASRFPRHWIYGPDGELVQKVAAIDFKDWYRHAFGRHTPWGDSESPAFVTAAETALERQLSVSFMRGGTRPALRKLRAGATLTEQGQPGDELHLVLDGLLSVEVDGKVIAEVGPGAVLGERALLEGGIRTSTLRAVTPCRIAVVRAVEIEPSVLGELSNGHRREAGFCPSESSLSG